MITSAAETVKRASQALLSRQYHEGFWWAELTADTTLESDYIVMELWLHPPVDGEWNPPSRARVDRAVQSILARQLPDGGFNIYQHGPSEVSASIKAYFALKLGGLPPDDSRMVRLRERILASGGLQAANSYVRINLSLFDLFPREACPSIPPEMILLPGKLIYQMSSWTRAIAISLAIVHSANPQRPVPKDFNLDELYVPGEPLHLVHDKKLFTVRNFFLGVDKLLKLWERFGPRSVRRYAVKRCEEWMLERFDGSGGLGAIYPPMQYAIMALDVLGYPPTHPKRAAAVDEFFRLMVDDERGFFFQPCFSVVWDTAIAMFALSEADASPESAMRRAADWLLSKEIRPHAETGASSGRMSSRQDGVSNSQTSSIPTLTTRLWFCLR